MHILLLRGAQVPPGPARRSDLTGWLTLTALILLFVVGAKILALLQG